MPGPEHDDVELLDTPPSPEAPPRHEGFGEVTHHLRALAREMVFPRGGDLDRLQREVDRLVGARLRRMRADLAMIGRWVRELDFVDDRAAYFVQGPLRCDLGDFTPGDDLQIEGRYADGTRINELLDTFPPRVLLAYVSTQFVDMEETLLEIESRLADAFGQGEPCFALEEELAGALSRLPRPALQALEEGRDRWEERLQGRQAQAEALLERLEQEEGPEPGTAREGAPPPREGGSP